MKPQTPILAALLGSAIGDALGVPVEFRPRSVLKKDPVVDMRWYGTHNQQAGTWSDDTSMALCSMEALLEAGDAPERAMAYFSRWRDHGHMTPYGVVFDIGNATSMAISRFCSKHTYSPPWGGTAESDNGNGSLMRMLPVALWLHRLPPERIAERASEWSSLTHAHPRARACCALYALVVRGLLAGQSVADALAVASPVVRPMVGEHDGKEMARLLDGSILQAKEEEVSGSGYVVHCLEASLWCIHRHKTFSDAVLAAVNLGLDTDTTGAVTGGLAGLVHGLEAIPTEWRGALANRDMVEGLCGRLAQAMASPGTAALQGRAI